MRAKLGNFSIRNVDFSSNFRFIENSLILNGLHQQQDPLRKQINLRRHFRKERGVFVNDWGLFFIPILNYQVDRCLELYLIPNQIVR